jgi:hypothetical protein
VKLASQAPLAGGLTPALPYGKRYVNGTTKNNGGAEHRAGLKARPYKPNYEIQLRGQHVVEGCYYLVNGLVTRLGGPTRLADICSEG